MDRVAHPAKVLVESCHASNQAVVDETPEAQQFSEDCLGFALSVSVFGPVSLRCKRDAQPYVYEQTRKRKARRNDSLTFYLSSSVRRSRLGGSAATSTRRRVQIAAIAANRHHEGTRDRRRKTRQNACGAHVYQARRTHHATHEEGPAKGGHCFASAAGAIAPITTGLACSKGEHQRAMPSDTSLSCLLQDKQTTGEVRGYQASSRYRPKTGIFCRELFPVIRRLAVEACTPKIFATDG
jgi:hypothetical protein